SVNHAGRARGLRLRYEHTAVARWLKGQRPRGQVPDLICEVLGSRLHRSVTLDDIGMGTSGAHTTSHGTGLSGFVEHATALWRSDEQQRAHLATIPAVTGTTAVMPVWEWENPPEDTDVSRPGPSRVGPADIAMLREARAHYELMYRKTGGIATRARVVGFLNAETAPLLRAGYSDATGRRLHRATGGLVAVAGICAYDSDAHGLAQRYFHQALRLAKASGDRGLGGYVIALLVNQSLHLADYRRSVAFAEAALRAAGPHISPALAADLYAMQAKAYARLGDPRSALERIRRAEAEAGRIHPGREPDETGYVQPGLVNVQVAEALLSLGDLTGAREHAAAAVRSPAHDRGRVHRLAMLTHLELLQGEADKAAGTASEMAERARGMESRRLRDRLRSVREHLAASGSADAEAAAGRIDGALRVPL
ncbi:transcriptional regulator, partial [Streptomyces clavifer]|uniref:transcriptional regulator n=1 Tax=Streptomyces clavifer TaxID=68188 RepID=UPI00366747FC